MFDIVLVLAVTWSGVVDYTNIYLIWILQTLNLGVLVSSFSLIFSEKSCLPYDGSVIPSDCEENEVPVYYEHSTSKIFCN